MRRSLIACVDLTDYARSCVHSRSPVVNIKSLAAREAHKRNIETLGQLHRQT